NGHDPRPGRAGELHLRIEHRQCHTHIRRKRGNALRARAQNGVFAVDAAHGSAARAGHPLVAGAGRIVEIDAAGALVEVAAVGGRVAQLGAGPG
nr:hypothetical protein [Tanacetum cinerariifolium]